MSDEDDSPVRNHEDDDEDDMTNIRLVDDIAEDGDDPDAEDEEEDDDLEEEEDLLDEEGSNKRRRVVEQDDSSHRRLDQERESAEVAGIEEALRRRYGDRGDDDDDAFANLDEEYNEVSNRTEVLPGIRDPKLYLVRCDPGMEQKAVVALLNKYYSRAALVRNPTREMHEHEQPLFITSAFTTPASGGYVFIEAPKEVHVKRAVMGIRALKWWSIKLIEIHDMVQAVKIEVKSATVKRKQWARVKGGLYKGDLALVTNVMDQGTVTEIKMIPRLDIAQLQEDYNNRGEERKKKKRGRGVRPLQKLFNKQQVQELDGFVQRKNGFDTYKNMKFKHGYLYKTINIRSLEITEVYPTQNEIEVFQARHGGEDDSQPSDDDSNQALPVRKRMKQFVRRDRVVVVSKTSDLFNLKGRVLKVFKGTVTVEPDHGSHIMEPTEFKLNEIKKYFEVGDHVKVLVGKYKNETGFIIEVKEKDDSILVHSDLSNNRMTLYSQDVIESSETSCGRDTLGGFDLHDLVQVGRDTVGCIIKIETGACKILSGNGVIKTIRLQEITKKRNSRFATALDANHQEIERDDIVRVRSGAHSGKQGTIKHIFHSHVFLYSPRHGEDTGIFVAQAKSVAQVGGDRFKAAQGRGGGRPRNTRINPRKDPLYEAVVVIRKGLYKGLMGIVRDVLENKVRVELHSKEKTVSISKEDVVFKKKIGEKEGARKGRGGGGGPAGFMDSGHKEDHWDLGGRSPAYLGARTPIHGDEISSGSRTPAHSGLGGMTPSRDSLGGMTPGHSQGWNTPSRDVWNPQTPHRAPQTPRENTHYTEDPDLDIELDPSWDGAEDGDDAHDAITPSISRDDELQTPHEVPDTPAEDEHHGKTPHTPFEAPPTPVDTPYDTPITPSTGEAPPTPSDPPLPFEGGEEEGVPNTPRTPYEHDDVEDDGEGAAALSSAFQTGAYVWLRADGKGLAIDDDVDEEELVMGHIVKLRGSGLTVELDGGDQRAVRAAYSKPVVPDKDDSVLIVDGEHSGTTGTLIGIDEGADGDGIVKIPGDIIVLPVKCLVKFHG